MAGFPKEVSGDKSSILHGVNPWDYRVFLEWSNITNWAILF